MSKSYQDLTVSEIAQLNQQAWENSTCDKVEYTLQEAIDALGLRIATAEETPHFVYKSERYVMEHSKTNRPIDMAAVKRHCEAMKAGRWVFNGEPFIFDVVGQIGSAQHRLLAFVLSCWEGNSSGTYRVFLIQGIPVEFGDTLDTGRSRSQKDIFARNPNVLEVEGLHDINGVSFGDKSTEVRKKLLGDLNTSVNFIRLRSSGKNVQTGGQAERAILHRVYKAFGDYGDNLLDTLVSLVYAYDLGQGTSPTYSTVIGRPVIVAALALWSMQKQTAWTKNGEWVGTVDIESATQFLAELSRSYVSTDGQLSRFFAELAKAKGQKWDETAGKWVKSNSRQELKREFVFGALVNAVRFVLDDMPLPNDSFIPRTKKDQKTYPAFGGVDCGYIAPQRGRKAEVEETEESEESEE